MTTLFAELSGHRVVDGAIVIPSFGLWHADVTVDTERQLPSGQLTLSFADLSLRCAPWRPIVPYQGKVRIRLIGGAAGWLKVIAAKPYGSVSGVKLSLILADAARLVGESVSIATDRVLGRHYMRGEAPACRLLNLLAPRGWWVAPDGITHIGPRASSAITSPLSLLSFDGARGVGIVATEKPADFVPGRTFRASTLASPITIGGVTHTITKGALRTEVLAA